MIKIQRDFLWQVNDGDRGMYWVAWEKICKPRKEGGLGIKNLELFNVALLNKWKWRALVEDNAPWRELFLFRYGSCKNAFIHRTEAALRRGGVGSIWWRDLLLLDSTYSVEFGQHVSIRLGEGASVEFWIDKWLGTTALSHLFPALFAGRDTKRIYVKDFGEWREGVWCWNADWLRSQFSINYEEAEYLQQLLLPIGLSQRESDRWIWMLENSKSFTVRSCYNALSCVDGGEESAALFKLMDKLWRCVAPSKVIIFGWRVLRDSLPTRANLFHRNVIFSEDDSLCPFCGQYVETQLHLFLSCPFANDVWSHICVWFRINPCSADSLFDHCIWWGKLITGKQAKKAKHLIWLTTCWNIWLARNALVFKTEPPNIDSIIPRIKYLSWSWLLYRTKCNFNFNISSWWDDPLHCLNNL